MKFLISKNELSHLLGKIQNIVPQKPTIPILSNLLIEASNDEIVIIATDLTVGMRCVSRAKVLEEGAITLPAKRFFQLVREIPNVDFEISSHPNHVTEIVAGSARFRLNSLQKDTFPALPDLENAHRCTIMQKDLQEVLFQTAFAVSREDTRFVLTGVYLTIKNGLASFVGTNGKRLAQAKASIQCDKGFQSSAIIPLKAIEEIQKILKDEGETTLYLMPDKIAVSTPDAMIISKLLSGEYPDFQRIIPENSAINVILHREEFMSCLRQISLFTTETTQSVRFSFTNGELTLSATHSDIGEGKTSIPVNYSGEPLDIAFNPLYFLDVLKHSKDDTVQLGLTDPYNPGIVTDNSSALFVLMPMRLYE